MQDHQMLDSELLYKIMTDDSSEICAELEQELNRELAKPHNEIDCDSVNEITAALCDIYGLSEVEIARGQGKCIARLLPECNRKRHIVNKWIKPFVACGVAVCLLLFVANLPIRSIGVDLIPEIIRTADGSVTLLLDGSRNAHLQPVKGQPDPFGVTELLASLEMQPFAPTYAPEGVTETNRTVHQCGYETEATVWYAYGDGIMFFTAFVDTDPDGSDNSWGFPTETYQLKSGEHGGIYMITLEEEGRYHAAFAVGNVRYHFSAKDVDFAVCHAIMESFATEPAGDV